MQLYILLNYYNMSTSNSQQFQKNRNYQCNNIVSTAGFDNFLVNPSELMQLKT